MNCPHWTGAHEAKFDGPEAWGVCLSGRLLEGGEFEPCPCPGYVKPIQMETVRG